MKVTAEQVILALPKWWGPYARWATRFAVHGPRHLPGFVRWIPAELAGLYVTWYARRMLQDNGGPACGAGGLGVQTPQVGSGEPTAATSSAHQVVGKGGAE